MTNNDSLRRAKIASSSALLWRRAYYFFVVAFPLLAFTAHLVAVLKTDSVHPVNDLHCDNTSPLWYDSQLSPEQRFIIKTYLLSGLDYWATLALPYSCLRLALSFLLRQLSVSLVCTQKHANFALEVATRACHPIPAGVHVCQILDG